MERHADLSRKRLPALSDDARGPDLDDWDYGSSALHPLGGASHWEPWRRALEGALPAAQRVDGDAAGAWDPDGPRGTVGGRVHSTALALLTLEVPYRYARVVGSRPTEPRRPR